MMLDTAVRSFLSRHGIRLNKDLGQHFLINESVLRHIIETADIRPTDHIVEIGAGIGILTRELVKKAQKVTTIEIDAKFIPLLKEFVATPMHLTIINDNALHVPFPPHPYKIVANIPYHITSPLLRHIFLESNSVGEEYSSPTEFGIIPKSLTLLIQREVAEKICDVNNAGLLTIIVGLFGAPKIVAIIPPSAFLPPPKVDSAILHIDCFKTPRTTPEVTERIFALVKLAFSQKRKMLRNTIGSLPDGIERLKQAEIDPKRRPQTLSIEEWIRLAKGQ